MGKYVNLHQHSEESPLDGYAKVSGIVTHAIASGSPAAVLTDHGVVAGGIQLAKAGKEHDLHVVHGMEGYWVWDIDRYREDSKNSAPDRYPDSVIGTKATNSHICLLAENDEGLSNLWAWSSTAWEERYHHKKPLADPALMRQYASGLWASDGCFAGSERFSTLRGTKTFEETVGTTQKVLGRVGRGPAWVDAEIRSFGVQPIVNLVVSRDGRRKTIATTINHRWYVLGKNRSSTERLTGDLRPGDRLISLAPPVCIGRTTPSAVGVQAGIVFGDGTVDRGDTGRRSARVKLYGTKDAQLLKWFPLQPTTACRTEDAIEVRGLPGYFKDAPSLTDSSLGYLYGWLAGYFAADGCVTRDGSVKFSSARWTDLQLVRDVCQVLGVRTGAIRTVDRIAPLPQGGVSHNPLYEVVLDLVNLHDDFFLIDAHRDRIVARRARRVQRWSEWQVESVKETDRVEEVFCAVVPQGHAFTLEDDIFTGNCMLTELGHAAEDGDEARAREIFGFLQGIFGDRFYSELHTWRILDPQTDKEKQLNQVILALNQMKYRLATEMGVPLVIVNDAHYTQEDDWIYHQLVWKFNTGNAADQTAPVHAADWQMSESEIYHHMSDQFPRQLIESCIDNSYDIAMSCHAEIKPTMTMPRLTTSDTEDMNMFLDAVQRGYMRKVVDAGLDENVYFPRMESECKLIVDKGFAGYFNITRDLVLSVRDGSYIQWVNGDVAKTPRLTGPGRGSAGGSLVSYLLDITSLDPLKYGLLFERFLTEDRTDWPDIDTDVPQSARPDTKSFVHARHEHTCAIGTRSRSQAAQTLKDLREPLKIDWADITEIGKLLKTLGEVVDSTGDEEMDEAAVANLSWGEIIELKGGELAPWKKKHPKLFDYMERMVGLVRQRGVHAAGVLIFDKTPLGRIPTLVKNGTRSTQFDMYEIEQLGAVKMDVLGIRHLDTLEQCRELVYERHGIWLDYDSSGYGMPEDCDRVVRFGEEQYSDPKIWEPIAQGDTLGIFQLETANGTQASMDFIPRSERDVCDLISVNRPGVIKAGQLPHYMARREGSERITYDHPLMESVTGPGWASDTYGILVYQEQLMRAAEVLAGFSPTEREQLRKIIGKKKLEQMVAMEGDFIARCLANPEFMRPYLGGKSPDERARTTAEKVWRSMLASGSYAFNRSHGMGYGLVATWEIWDKYYFFPEFITSLLRTDPKKINRYIRTARQRGLKVLPPDVNHSQGKFTLVDGDIRYGLQAIYGVGESAVQSITAAQPYVSFRDFLDRSGVGKTVVINLIKIGAFDSFDTRERLIRVYERYRIMDAKKGASVIVGGKRVPKDKLTEAEIDLIVEQALATPKRNRDDEIIGPSPWLLECPDFSDEKTIIAIEQELVGNFVTIDPMYRYLDMIETHCLSRTIEVKSKEKGAMFAVGGVLSKIYEHTIKQGKNKGQKMAFLGVTWNDEEFDITVFAETWREYKSYLHLDSPVIINCIRDAKGAHMTNVIRLDWALPEEHTA